MYYEKTIIIIFSKICNRTSDSLWTLFPLARLRGAPILTFEDLIWRLPDTVVRARDISSEAIWNPQKFLLFSRLTQRRLLVLNRTWLSTLVSQLQLMFLIIVITWYSPLLRLCLVLCHDDHFLQFQKLISLFLLSSWELWNDRITLYLLRLERLYYLPLFFNLLVWFSLELQDQVQDLV